MPGLTDTGENELLDAVWNADATGLPSANLFIALHTADPGENGSTNEVAGGSYARQQADFAAAGSGTTSNAANIDFASMPAVPTPGVVAWSAWTLVTGGTCWWTGWFSTVSELFVVEAADLTGNDITSPSHGLVNDDRVTFEAVVGEGTLPTGISEGTLYWVLATTTDTFTISTTQDGGAVDITAVGSGVWRKIAGKVVANAGDTLRIPAGDLDVFLG